MNGLDRDMEMPQPPDEPKEQGELRSKELLAELDGLYKRFKGLQHTATWGGSFEREHGAAMEIKPVVNAMFDKLVALMELRSANESSSQTGASK